MSLLEKTTARKPDACPWRRSANGSSRFKCALIKSFGADFDEFSVVSEDSCLACCRSFPPSEHQINPVVAGLVYSAASVVVDRGGTLTCSRENAIRIQQGVESALNLEFPEHLTLLPARHTTNCCWLGDPLAAITKVKHQPHPFEAQSEASDLEEFNCLHPAHDVATPPGCRMCRDWLKAPPISRLLSIKELVPFPVRRCGPRVKEWAVAVTTSPRRRPTLELSLDAIARAGWEHPRVFVDGPIALPSRFSHLPVTWRDTAIGAFPAWYFALAELALSQPDADAYLIFQDDVTPFDRECLRDYLERALWPGDEPAPVSLFYSGLDTTAGWHSSPRDWHWGAQAFVFPQQIVRALLTDPSVSGALLSASGQRHIPIPELLCAWTRRKRIDVWYTIPSLVQHVGNTSTIWMDAAISEGRKAFWFSGSIDTEFGENESLADFPEATFASLPEAKEAYDHCIELGRRKMREQRVVVCGVARDVRHFLARSAARIERLGSLVRDYRVVLYENDSVDGTREFLADWQSANNRVLVLSETIGVPRLSNTRDLQRAEWLASCRNRYRTAIVERFSNFDYAIVVDLDLAGGWSFDGIAHSFGNDDWDAMGSYGVLRRLGHKPTEQKFSHVDAWAFRPRANTALFKKSDIEGLRLRRGEMPILVDSCFGGLAIYRMACMSAAEYGGTDCEHVVFHERLRRAGLDRLFINPNQIVLYSPA